MKSFPIFNLGWKKCCAKDIIFIEFNGEKKKNPTHLKMSEFSAYLKIIWVVFTFHFISDN